MAVDRDPEAEDGEGRATSEAAHGPEASLHWPAGLKLRSRWRCMPQASTLPSGST